jgi:small-conductance mechanosensitive channel
VNYTKIYTPTYNLMEIPNIKVLDSKILNYSTGDVFDYTFQVGFPHEVPNEEIISKCIVPAIEAFYEKYKDILPRKPEFSMSSMDRLGRSFAIRMFFPEKKIKTFYDIQPELMRSIVARWDNLRKQKK